MYTNRQPGGSGGDALLTVLPSIVGAEPPGHSVQFYETDDALHGVVAAFLADGLAAGEVAVLFARHATWEAVLARLQASGVETMAAMQAERLRRFDALVMLDRFMIDGRPDRDRFRAAVGSALAGDALLPVRAFGEMVDVLWERDDHDAALQVEAYWNEITAERNVSLLCAYALDRFGDVADADAFVALCGQHDHVIPGESFSLLVDADARNREVAALQRRARALEAEIERRRQLEGALREALAERSAVEAALKKARDEAQAASRAKSDFLAVMSHELRTPLNAIIGYDELLAMELGGPITAEQRTFVERIRTAAQQLLDLVDQILSLSRIEAGKEDVRLEEIEVGGLVAEAVALIEADARLKGLTLTWWHDEEVRVRCTTDPHKVRQILLNLLSNAVKFTELGRIEVRVRGDVDAVLVDVQDSGPGLDEADSERIFDEFVQVDSTSTRAQGGTGLGLAVSRRLARLLGGDVRVTATARGTGSTFTLRLPAG